MHQTIELFSALGLFVLAISHIAQPRAWVDFFVRLRSAGDAGVFMVAMLHFWPGILVAATHNVWSGWGIVLTIIGWGWITKGSLYLIVPAAGRWTLSRVGPERKNEFVWAGLVLMVIAGVVSASGLQRVAA